MSSGFIDVATTSSLVGEDEDVPVRMPGSVQAGDYLVAMMGNIYNNVIDNAGSLLPPGWINISSSSGGYVFYKVADGTEGGTTATFHTLTSFPAGPRRAFLGAVMQYRFAEVPTAVTTVGATLNFGSASPGDDAVSGTYGAFVSGYEIRVYGFIGSGSDASFVTYPIAGHTWTNADERANISHTKGDGSLQDTISLITADYGYLTASSQRVNLRLDGSAFFGVGGDLFGVRFTFATPTQPPIECIREVFGYATTTDPGFEFTQNQNEPGGYTKTGGLASIYPVGPISGAFYLDGALIIATVRRYTWQSSTPPPRGTLSGFGATWDLIDYQEAVGNDGAAFVEIYRAMQPTFGPFPEVDPFPAPPPTGPEGYLTYTFPPNADRNFSSVGWKSFRGADLAGLADNGASAIQNLTSYPVTGATSTATFTHTAPTRDTNSILWTGFWVMEDDSTGGDSFFTLAESGQILDINPFFDDGYGSQVAHQQIPPPFSSEPVHVWETSENANNFAWFTDSWHYTWTTPGPRTWWAKSLEILIDPLIVCAEDVAYWGILATEM